MSYHAVSKVAWSIGDPAVLFRGGVKHDGTRSCIQSPPIIAVAGSEAMSRVLREAIPLGDRNDLLFRRDHHRCAYCGQVFGRNELTRDHVLARSRGGADVWSNVVAACRACNERKAARTPEEARMSLRYVPYAPCRYEHFILSGRNILADQMEYLAAKLPRHSRWVN
ncbi:MAG TPA: HNH endonuclease [Burkholderiales bacterium]